MRLPKMPEGESQLPVFGPRLTHRKSEAPAKATSACMVKENGSLDTQRYAAA